MGAYDNDADDAAAAGKAAADTESDPPGPDGVPERTTAAAPEPLKPPEPPVLPPPARAPASAPEQAAPAGRRGPGIAGLSTRYQVVAAVALAVVGVVGCVHLAMVFLHVAPSNTLTKQHGTAVDDWIYPELEQNWKLFAPNPLQQNIAVEARVQIRGADGTRRTTGWIGLTAQDTERIRGNIVPSHTEQNELRRAWEFFLNFHAEDQLPNGLRGELSEGYLRRIVISRLDERELGGTVQKIQVRSVTRAVPAPAWSTEKIDTRPVYRTYRWWSITDADRPAFAAEAGAEAGAGTGTSTARTETAAR
ncbi:DUF5819 family protein [Streptomyces laurentii]|uniref:DUF5819 family protein n=1 Tax=Streptomyces laurentii TaxID=39478 RepID=UPI00368AD5FE